MLSDQFIIDQARRVRVQVQEDYEYPEQDINYQGHKLTNQLKMGPIELRECQNTNCIILYCILWVLMIYCAINTWGRGNIYDIYMPYDCVSRQCGRGITKDYPNVYLLSELEYYCVSRCPGSSDVGLELPCYRCSAKVAPYSTIQFFTLCVPTESEDSKYRDLVTKINYLGDSQQYYADIQETWPIILVCAAVAFLTSAIVLILIRHAAAGVVWGMVTLIFLLVEGVGGLYYSAALGSFGEIDDQEIITGLKTTSYAFIIAGIAMLVLILLQAKQINQAIVIMRAASEFIKTEWQIIFVPVLMQFVIVGIMTFWMVFSALIFSATSNENKAQNNPYVLLYLDSKTFWQIMLFLLGTGWNVYFINALTHFVIGTCCCYWYYSHQGVSRKGTIKKGFRNGVTKNLGSLLYGGGILSFIWFFKFFLKQFDSFYQWMFRAGTKAPCVCTLFAYYKFYSKCFNQLVKFLDKNAYTIMALTGKDFCQSANDGFYLVYRNASRVTFTQGLGEVFQYLGVVFIGAISAAICYFCVYFKTNILNPLIPSILAMFVSGFIGSFFMLLYGYGVDTIMFCLIVDIEQNRNEGGPQSVPPILKKYTSEIIV